MYPCPYCLVSASSLSVNVSKSGIAIDGEAIGTASCGSSAPRKGLSSRYYVERQPAGRTHDAYRRYARTLRRKRPDYPNK